jgi:hypothetical protein
MTIGGDWAGSDDVYSASGCPSTCIGRCSTGFNMEIGNIELNLDHVNNDPSSFKNAMFDFAAIRIYTPT